MVPRGRVSDGGPWQPVHTCWVCCLAPSHRRCDIGVTEARPAAHARCGPAGTSTPPRTVGEARTQLGRPPADPLSGAEAALPSHSGHAGAGAGLRLLPAWLVSSSWGRPGPRFASSCVPGPPSQGVLGPTASRARGPGGPGLCRGQEERAGGCVGKAPRDSGKLGRGGRLARWAALWGSVAPAIRGPWGVDSMGMWGRLGFPCLSSLSPFLRRPQPWGGAFLCVGGGWGGSPGLGPSVGTWGPCSSPRAWPAPDAAAASPAAPGCRPAARAGPLGPR